MYFLYIYQYVYTVYVYMWLHERSSRKPVREIRAGASSARRRISSAKGAKTRTKKSKSRQNEKSKDAERAVCCLTTPRREPFSSFFVVRSSPVRCWLWAANDELSVIASQFFSFFFFVLFSALLEFLSSPRSDGIFLTGGSHKNPRARCQRVVLRLRSSVQILLLFLLLYCFFFVRSFVVL